MHREKTSFIDITDVLPPSIENPNTSERDGLQILNFSHLKAEEERLHFKLLSNLQTIRY